MILKEIKTNKIFTSRNEASLEITLENEKGLRASAKIPAGVSTGEKEVVAFPYEEAEKSVENLKPALQRNFSSQKALDKFLLSLDSTPNKKEIGGNVSLGISLAFLKLLALQKKQELWQVLRKEFFADESEEKLPFIFSNFIEGGRHAKNNLNIQEYLIVLNTGPDPRKAVEDLISLYKKTGEKLFENGACLIGDEAGYVKNFSNNLEPLKLLSSLIMGDARFSLAVDVAASEFFLDGKYNFENTSKNSLEMISIYKKYFEEVPELISIEDPFSENDEKGFKTFLKEKNDKWIVGDDLTVTNPQAIKKFGGKLINAVIIKPNQIGTVLETCLAIKVAKKKGLKIVLSHRGGEVDENFIVHFAKAANADALKIGAPARERIFKFNEFLKIYG